MTWAAVPGSRVGTGRGPWAAALGDPAAGHVAEYRLTMEDFGRVRAAEGWHVRYGGAGAGGAAAKFVEGEVY